MKAEELRCGITVIIDGDIETVTGPLLIYCLERNLNRVLPITLTKEWLTKFGFYQMHKNESDPDLGVYVKDSVKISLSYSGWYAYQELYHITPAYEYVHQLQNLFYMLTGKELK